MTSIAPPVSPIVSATSDDIAILESLEQKVLWLASYMIHNANHIRPSRDGLKVGGHQASSASLVSIMTALYFHSMRAEDRVAVKPHASPIMHAIMYLMGRQSLDSLKTFRGFGGAQSYPSITKDKTDIDFSTGSVGMGVAATLFNSLVQDYMVDHHWMNEEKAGRMIALAGDAEFDEGNIFEALLEGWKHKVGNLWWVVDYNRQSLDGVVDDALFEKISGVFDSLGWQVHSLKYGKKLLAAREGPAGEAILNWIDNCPNQLYSALTFQGGPEWRRHLELDLQGTSGIKEFLDGNDDNALQSIMTNLGGHDMISLTEAFANADDGAPHCFIAYTIKGYGLPLAGHKDNHAGMMSPAQLATFQHDLNIPAGAEWDKCAGLSVSQTLLERHIKKAPYQQRTIYKKGGNSSLAVPEIETPDSDLQSTQEAFGKIMFELAKGDSQFADRIVTTSPDVTSSTNLGGWVNRRKLYALENVSDTFKDRRIPSTQLWSKGPSGQHIELGIAENNLFSLLGQLGLSERHFGERLIPIGTLYDPFISRGLDALNYGLYQGARFLLVATPSGITLGPEGGAHQSINTPLIGLSQPGLVTLEPAYADELAIQMAWSFKHMQKQTGSSVYLRLSTRKLPQLPRKLNVEQTKAIEAGAYWLREPIRETRGVIIYTGALAPEVFQAVEMLAGRDRGLAVLAVTSADLLYKGWTEQQTAKTPHTSHITSLFATLPRDAKLVTACDAHPLTLSWLGTVNGNPVHPLGVQQFGQTGDLVDLYSHHGLDAATIVEAYLK